MHYMNENDKTVEQIEYLTRIASHYDVLSESEKKIADYILRVKTDILNMTTADIAENVQTSAATVVRFCRTLGFKGFNEFKFYIEREFLSPSDEIMQIEPNDSVAILKQKTFQFNKKVIDETEQLVDDEALELAVKTLYGGKKYPYLW